jgi:hypothetical protein
LRRPGPGGAGVGRLFVFSIDYALRRTRFQTVHPPLQFAQGEASGGAVFDGQDQGAIQCVGGGTGGQRRMAEGGHRGRDTLQRRQVPRGVHG